MVYGTSNELVTGANLNQRSHHNRGPHIVGNPIKQMDFFYKPPLVGGISQLALFWLRQIVKNDATKLGWLTYTNCGSIVVQKPCVVIKHGLLEKSLCIDMEFIPLTKLVIMLPVASTVKSG